MSSDCDDFMDASEVMVEPDAVNGGGRPRPQLLNLSAELAMPQIALFPATPKTLSPANGKPEPVASRRSRLSILRSRMHSEFGADISDGSASETTSLASWGRNLLFEHKHDCSRSEGGVPRVAYATDTISTRAMPAFTPVTTLPPPSLPPPPRSAPPLTTVSSNAKSATVTEPISNPMTAAVLTTESNRSSTSYSSAASSKSSTLDRAAATADNGLPHPPTAHHTKTNSLDRGLSLKTIRAGPFPPHHTKTNSLSREFSTSFSSCDPPSYLVLDDSESQRNSEAVGIINEITNDLLHGVSVRDDTKSLSRSEDSTNVSRTGRLSVVEERASPEHQETPSRPQSAANGSLAEEPVHSSNVTPLARAVIPTVQPVKPPRRKKLSDASDSRTLPPMERQETLTNDSSSIINNSSCLLPSSPASPEYFSPRETPLRDSAILPLTKEDLRVLEQVPTKNLDTGESTTLLRHLDRTGSIDPITKDIGRRMSLKQHHSFRRDGSTPGGSVPSDDTSSTHSFETDAISTMSSTSKIGHAFTAIRGNMRAVGKVVKGVYVKAKHATVTAPVKLDDRDGSSSETEDDDNESNESTGIVRPKNAKKGPFDFDQLRQVQDLSGEHTGAVWCLKFSLCGRLLATAGQDNMIRVWVLRNHYDYFNTMRERYNLETKRAGGLTDGLLQKTLDELEHATQSMPTTLNREQREETASTSSEPSERSGSAAEDIWAPFAAKPFCTYRGHTADVLDLSWSKNYFILSSGMDRTVRLWHVSRPECLCCFQHMDFVTSIAFLPKDDRYFLSGSLDGKLRLWHIPDKKVALWNEVEQAKLITAMTFVKNGKFAVVGTYNGRCIFFSTDLKYHTMIDVRSTRGKNARGHKVTGLAVHGDKLLVTSNDSRVRMYDLRDMALTCKYKGASNERSQIRATFSPDGRHIICGSEDRYVYLWRTAIDAKESLAATLSVRKDRNAMWERVRGHNAVVTAAIFAPKPQLVFTQIENMKRSSATDLFATTPMSSNKSATTPKGKTIAGDVVVSADLSGAVKVFINRTRIKTGSSVFFPTD